MKSIIYEAFLRRDRGKVRGSLSGCLPNEIACNRVKRISRSLGSIRS